jgi:hypothetical protein
MADYVAALHWYLAVALHGIVADVPNPGTGTQPPGTGGLVTILGWVAWGACALCVAGLVIVAGKMAINHERGVAGQHATGLAWVMLACVVVGAASGLVGALV